MDSSSAVAVSLGFEPSVPPGMKSGQALPAQDTVHSGPRVTQLLKGSGGSRNPPSPAVHSACLAFPPLPCFLRPSGVPSFYSASLDPVSLSHEPQAEGQRKCRLSPPFSTLCFVSSVSLWVLILLSDPSCFPGIYFFLFFFPKLFFSVWISVSQRG